MKNHEIKELNDYIKACNIFRNKSIIFLNTLKKAGKINKDVNSIDNNDILEILVVEFVNMASSWIGPKLFWNKGKRGDAYSITNLRYEIKSGEKGQAVFELKKGDESYKNILKNNDGYFFAFGKHEKIQEIIYLTKEQFIPIFKNKREKSKKVKENKLNDNTSITLYPNDYKNIGLSIIMPEWYKNK